MIIATATKSRSRYETIIILILQRCVGTYVEVRNYDDISVKHGKIKENIVFSSDNFINIQTFPDTYVEVRYYERWSSYFSEIQVRNHYLIVTDNQLQGDKGLAKRISNLPRHLVFNRQESTYGSTIRWRIDRHCHLFGDPYLNRYWSDETKNYRDRKLLARRVTTVSW